MQLWSGIFGAATSAVTSAIVAVLILYFSNKHQKKLSDNALDEQRRLAAEATSAQRRQAMLDRLEQQRAMSLQISEQRAEASKARVYAAISDLVTAVDNALNKYQAREKDEDLYVRARSAVVRLRLDIEDDRLGAELQDWPFLLWRVLRDAQLEQARPISDRTAERLLVSAAGAITNRLPLWPRADEMRRQVLLDQLGETRESVAAGSEEYRRALPKWKDAVTTTPSSQDRS